MRFDIAVGLLREHIEARRRTRVQTCGEALFCSSFSYMSPMQNLPLSGAALLVVQDEPLVALDLRQNLESAGAYVFAATQLSHALQLAGHPDITAAVLDYRLADGDATPICTLLSERGIPFVFYSGYDDARQSGLMRRMCKNPPTQPRL